MNDLQHILEKYGLIVDGIDKKYICVKAKTIVLTFDMHNLFGMEESDVMLYIKQRFYSCNIKIDLIKPENNNPTVKKPISVSEKKRNIRKILKSNKLLPIKTI